MDIDEICFRLVPGFEGLDETAFSDLYAKQVGNLFQEREVTTCRAAVPPYGMCQIRVLVGGLVVVKARKGKFLLFETQARVAEREHLRSWAEFARGIWVSKVPSVPGTYPTRDKAGFRGKDRTLIMHEGKLKDVTGGFVGAGRVSEWMGDWYSLPYPPLPGAI